MYLDDLAAEIKEFVPKSLVPEEDADDLFRLYALLLRAKGAAITESDVHDAWSAWMIGRDTDHQSLVEYDALPAEVREQDRKFLEAIRAAANRIGAEKRSLPTFTDVLFPSGPPQTREEIVQAVDLYKIMVDSSESLVKRRQGVNTFFLTINGALLTAAGLIVQTAGSARIAALAIAVLAVAGAILCGAWRSLITSFGQLNTGKFRVINTIERYLPISIYEAEWEALGRGENPEIYRSFTSREIWVPSAFLILYVVAVVVALLVAFECVSLGIEAAVL